MILHVCTVSEWEVQATLPNYKPASFDAEKFVHCCLPSQLDGVLGRYFIGKTNLLVLSIDESLLDAEVLYERGPNGDSFPHVYGPISREAIVGVRKLS